MNWGRTLISGGGGGGFLSNIFIPFGSATLVNTDPAAVWFNAVHSSQYFNYRSWITIASIGDEYHFRIPLKAGTYDITFIHEKNIGFGIADLYFNNTFISSLDFYNGSFAIPVLYNFSSSIASDSEVLIKMVTTGKNASSSGYAIPGTGFLIRKR